MIYLFYVWFISQCLADLQVSLDLREQYLANEPIIIQITVQNIGKTEIDVPDLGAQPWRTSFYLHHENGNKQKRNNTKNQKTNRWKIPPRSARSVQLEIPSSAGLSTGKYELTVEIDSEISKYKEQKTIHIAKSSAKNVDTHRRINQKLEVLWGQPNQKGIDLYLNNGQWNQYLRSWKAPQKPKLLICSSCTGKYHWRQNNDIYVQGKTLYKISPPWPKFEIIDRGIIAKEGLIHLVVWIPQKQKGSLWLLTIDRKGVPDYRKMRGETTKPTSCNGFVNNQEQALFLVYHQNYIELFTVNKPPRKLPVPSKKIASTNKTTTIQHAQFLIHPQNGLAILTIQKENNSYFAQWYGLQGIIIGERLPTPIHEKMKIRDIINALIYIFIVSINKSKY